MNKKKNILIKQLFSHLEGIVTIPTVTSLDNHKILNQILDQDDFTLESLSVKESTQAGYLNVALTTLASLGVLDKSTLNDKILYQLTDYGREFLSYSENYHFYNQIRELLNNFIANDVNRDDLDNFIKIIEGVSDSVYKDLRTLHLSHNQIQKRIAHHIEGVMLFPLLLYISYNNLDSKERFNIELLIKNILAQDKTMDPQIGYDYFISKSKSYGVTASYQPIFSNLGDIIFHNKNLSESRDNKGKELHVNRRLNVWGSGGAHKTYFKKIDDIIIDIFNMPIENQPLGIADMGCGDGMFLEHLYDLIVSKTIRGNHLNTYPLTLVGADLNQEAINVAQENLSKLNIKCNFLISDISNPDKYKDDLKSNFNIDISNLLHVRSFLDHNRIYQTISTMKENISLTSTGAYCYKGKHLTSMDVTRSLINHLALWKKYISKHGLLILELHGLETSLAQSNKSSTPTIAYEATHGYSDQYIVEYDIFLQCANLAGLRKIDEYSKVFPNENLVTISLNMFK